MDFESYYLSIEQLTQDFISCEDESAIAFLERKFLENDIPNGFFDWRKDLWGTAEDKRMEGFGIIATQYFQNFTIEDRLVWLFISFEIEDQKVKQGYKTHCQIYHDDHPIFINSPLLMEQVLNGDLINYEVLAQVDRSEVLKFKNGYGILAEEIDPYILYWARTKFPKCDIYVRINPFIVHLQKPSYKANEATIVPADPNWWKELRLYKNTSTGASYVLEDCDIKDNQIQWYEYHSHNIRQFESSAQRKNDGTLSMMIEELQEKSDELMVGRCIHLDTKAEVGTAFEEVILMHLDLAINVYFDESVKDRKSRNLAQGGKVTDASCRTHLFRINDIPMIALLDFVLAFFRSTTLVDEWLNDQFRITNTVIKS